MTRDELIAQALAFAGAVEDYPFGEDLLAIKVGGKVFAWTPARRDRLARSGSADGGDAARRARHRVAVRLSPPGGPRTAPSASAFWVTIPLGAAIPDSEARELLALSYGEVLARLPRSRRPTDHTSDPR